MKPSKKLINGLIAITIAVNLMGGTFAPAAQADRHDLETPEAAETTATDNLPPDLVSQIEEGKNKLPTDKKDGSEFAADVAKLTTYINFIFNPAIHFLTQKIGGLLNNDRIYAGKMGEMLQDIWRVNRNIVNIAFVLILLFLALRHIFSGDENTDLKKVLPMFAITLVAVNFSWMASKVILDAANVATNITFSLPSAVSNLTGSTPLATEADKRCQTDAKGAATGLCVPAKVFFPAGSNITANLPYDQCKDLEKEYDKAYVEGKKTGTHQLHDVATFCWKTVDLGEYDQNSASYYLSYSMARVQNLTQASTTDASAKGVFKIAIGAVFSLVIQVVYLTTFFSLFLALILRTSILWMFVSFSPFLVLLAFLQKNVQELKMEGGGEMNLGAFLQWAFAPAKVGAVWAVGFIMITTGQSLSVGFFEQLNDLGAKFQSKTYELETIFQGMDNLDQFIWLLMTIVVIWVGTFAVLKNLKFGGQIFERINQAGTGLAKRVAESPTWAPIVPIYDHSTGEWTRGSLQQFLPNMNKMLDKMKGEYTGELDVNVTLKASSALTAMGKDKINSNLIQKLKTGTDDQRAAAVGQFMNSINISDQWARDHRAQADGFIEHNEHLSEHAGDIKKYYTLHLNRTKGQTPAAAAAVEPQAAEVIQAPLGVPTESASVEEGKDAKGKKGKKPEEEEPRRSE